MKINYNDPMIKLTGIWQERNEGISSYGTIAFLEVGFSGENLILDCEIIGNAIFYFDGNETAPDITENGLYFSGKSAKHILKVKVYGDGHFCFRSAVTDGFFLKPEKNKYIHFIGDSITHAYPGFASVAAESLGWDYSVVAECGMALVDGWGWYEIPPFMKERIGMETRYFQLESCRETGERNLCNFAALRKPDIVVIFLGTNDYLNSEKSRQCGNVEIFAEHYLCFVSKLRNLYPNSDFYILKGITDTLCRNEAIESAFKLISKQIDNSFLIPSDKWDIEICKDGTHPTQYGYKQIADNLIRYLNNKGQ